MTDVLEDYSPGWASAHRARTGRPFVTLSYAQSLDGSITLRRGQPSPISGDESKRITHVLRAAHDAILVGVETVLADDPRLTARRVGGPDPQPVVVDSRLRFPLTARLLQNPRGVWIATTGQAAASQAQMLEAKGARVFCLPAAADGRVELGALLARLGQWEVDSLMVEGGSQVITSFLRSQLADRLVLTIAPVVAGGYPAVQALSAETWSDLPRLQQMKVTWAGADLMLWGDFA
jgi:GTP cyclohydrolase II